MELISVTYQFHLCLLRKSMLTCIFKSFLSLTLITKTFLVFDILENAIFTENPPIIFIFNFAFIKLKHNIYLNIILITSLFLYMLYLIPYIRLAISRPTSSFSSYSKNVFKMAIGRDWQSRI